MKTVLIICGTMTGTIGLIILFFFIKLKIETRKSGYRHVLNQMCYEDEDCEGQDFTYKKIRRKD